MSYMLYITCKEQVWDKYESRAFIISTLSMQIKQVWMSVAGGQVKDYTGHILF